ncbi:ABC transporter permease [Aquabacterium sp. NJ1]|uniref:ABC transporter permease n=1 Tax=Aquabacterium sp. NJ1 TaxID=1538295 RepID=UPI00052C0C87|nr:ABC transporter permease [Aquabacterium sp. NJ1]KGM40942.1 ABC transporter permease [Aquabacterium sp. NJ1]
MRVANWAQAPIPHRDPRPAATPALTQVNGPTVILHDAPPPTRRATLPDTASRPGWLRAWLTRQWLPMLLGAVSIGAVLLMWDLATRYKLDLYIRFANIPTPAAVFEKLLEVNKSPQFMTNIGISVRRIMLGFVGAALSGMVLGLLIGRYRFVRMLTLPALEVLRPIPAIAWVPMSIMLWPDNEVSIVFITFIGAFFPILLNTIHGVEGIDPVLLRAARCLGCPERHMLWQIMLPAALPHIFTGLAVGMGVAWVSLIAAEMISGQFGIGYFTWEAYSLISYAEIALGMITIGVLGLLCSGAIRLAARMVMPWQASSSKGGA